MKIKIKEINKDFQDIIFIYNKHIYHLFLYLSFYYNFKPFISGGKFKEELPANFIESDIIKKIINLYKLDLLQKGMVIQNGK